MATRVADPMERLCEVSEAEVVEAPLEYSEEEPLLLGPSAFPGGQTARRPGIAVGSQRARKATSIDDVMELLNHLAVVKEMKVTIHHCKRGALLAGASTFLGGLLGGPPGIAVGGAVGVLLGAWMSSGQFKPVRQILLELSPTERKKLCEEVLGRFRNLDCADARDLIAFVMKNDFVQQKLIGVLGNYLWKKLGAKIVYGN